MKSRRIEYPFVPKSTASLVAGQFWALPLSDGSFACGRVVQLAPVGMMGARVSFLGAVLDWVSSSPPTSATIAGALCVAQGHVHIKAITETGGEVLAHRSLELDGIAPWLFRGAHGWQNSSVQVGLIPIRPQTPAYYGARVKFGDGDAIVPRDGFVYFTPNLDAATWGAELAAGGRRAGAGEEA